MLGDVIEHLPRNPASDTHTPSGHSEIPALEQELLAELRAALAEREIGSVLRPDLGCLAVDTLDGDRKAWIFLSFENRYFSWNNAEEQHPVFDIDGAAR